MALEMRPLQLLTLALGVASAQKTLEEVPVQQDFDAQKVEGHWLTLQLAATNPGLVSPDDPLRLSLHSVWTTGGGGLRLLLFWTGEGACDTLSVTVHPTSLQGQYQGTCSPPVKAGGRVLVRIVGTDYRSLILYARVEQDAETNGLWALLARTASEDPKWLRQYLEYVRQFHLESAWVPSRKDSPAAGCITIPACATSMQTEDPTRQGTSGATTPLEAIPAELLAAAGSRELENLAEPCG